MSSKKPDEPPRAPRVPGGGYQQGHADRQTDRATLVRKPNPPRGRSAIRLAQREEDLKRFEAQKSREAAPKPKKKLGRPATGRDPGTVVRLPEFMLEQIDRWAEEYPGLTRSSAIRVLLETGLLAKKKPSVRDPKSLQPFYRAEKPPAPSPSEPSPSTFRPRRKPRAMSKEEIAFAVERAEALLKK